MRTNFKGVVLSAVVMRPAGHSLHNVSTAFQLLGSGYPGKQPVMAHVVGSLTLTGETCMGLWLTASVWSSPDCFGHLGSEAAGGNFFNLFSK